MSGFDVCELDGASYEVDPATGGPLQSTRARKVEYLALLPMDALATVAAERAAAVCVYGPESWTRIPVADHIGHAIEHLLCYQSGDTSEHTAEEHLAHAALRSLMALASADDKARAALMARYHDAGQTGSCCLLSRCFPDLHAAWLASHKKRQDAELVAEHNAGDAEGFTRERFDHIPPGAYIEEEMEERGWSHQDLADRLGLSMEHVLNLVQGKARVTQGVANALERVFDIEAAYWLKVDAIYQEHAEFKARFISQEEARRIDAAIYQEHLEQQQQDDPPGLVGAEVCVVAPARRNGTTPEAGEARAPAVRTAEDGASVTASASESPSPDQPNNPPATEFVYISWEGDEPGKVYSGWVNLKEISLFMPPSETGVALMVNGTHKTVLTDESGRKLHAYLQQRQSGTEQRPVAAQSRQGRDLSGSSMASASDS